MDEEINRRIQEHFDEMNSVGVGILLLFNNSINDFVDNERRRELLQNRVLTVCDGSFQVSARDFVKRISYEDFKRLPSMSEITVLGFRLWLKYQCGVDWLNPNVKIKAF